MPDGYTPVAQLIADSGDPWSICVDHYSRQPNAFWREVLGRTPDPWQQQANRALAHGHRRIAVRSGHGVGKGMWLASSICWFCLHQRAVQGRRDRAVGAAIARRADGRRARDV